MIVVARVNINLSALTIDQVVSKRRKVVTFEGQMLLQGAHDHIDVILLTEDVPESG